MYSSIVEITQNREFLESVKKGWSYGSNLNILSSLPSYDACIEYEQLLSKRKHITFDRVFHEPLGYYLIKSFLVLHASDDKAVFVSDVELYKSLTDPSARIHISKKIYNKYCTTRSNTSSSSYSYIRGISVFDTQHNHNNDNNDHDIEENVDLYSNDLSQQTDDPSSISFMNHHNHHHQQMKGGCKDNYVQLASQSQLSHSHQPQMQQHHHQNKNAIDVTGQCIEECFYEIYHNQSSSLSLFDSILRRVLHDLRNNIFPSFIKSPLYKLYIQCIYYTYRYSSSLCIDSFSTLRVLGRGAFGFVNACIKKNSGHIYAMKCINKKRVMATDSVETIMSERNFLSDMTSNFVTGLKYALQDSNTLYLIIDLMVGGDLKFHLNKEGRFNIERSRFYASEVLLGLQHIHSKGIIYRDIKLENVLLDSNGHCKISDLGLAVRSKTKVRGYAGTPGYTAPEVCLQQSYDKCADFFSFGVMIYRFLSGRKPFQIRSSNKDKNADKDKNNHNNHRTGNELDKNVVEIEPEYPDRYFTPSARSLLKGLMCKNPRNRLASFIEIKNHPWFAEKIDFGLLESGNLIPPFIPNQDEINADSLRHIGRPPNDDKYKDVEITKKFENSLSKFPYISSHAQQKEIVEILQKINKHYSFETFIKTLRENDHQKISINELASIPSERELNEYAQNFINLKKEKGIDSFIPSYYLQQQKQQQIASGSSGSSASSGGFDGDDDDDESSMTYDDDEDDYNDGGYHQNGNNGHNNNANNGNHNGNHRNTNNGNYHKNSNLNNDSNENEEDIGHHYDHDTNKNEKYNKIETSSSSKYHKKKLLDRTGDKKTTITRGDEKDKEDDDHGEGELFKQGNSTESSVSHSNVADDMNIDEDGNKKQRTSSSNDKNLNIKQLNDGEEIKPINTTKNNHRNEQHKKNKKNNKKNNQVHNDYIEAPKTNTNQCMSCVIL